MARQQMADVSVTSGAGARVDTTVSVDRPATRGCPRYGAPGDGG